jgi:hypothetical protein
LHGSPASGSASAAPHGAATDPDAHSDAARQQLDDAILEASRANPKKVPLVLRAWMES